MTVKIMQGDCLELLPTLEPDSVDACVTDPPYGLQFMGREWDKLWRNKTGADQAYVDRTKGELTSRARKLPDYSVTNPQQMQAWHEQWCREVLRVLKPGGHMLCFGGTRTFHRVAVAIEDAGFEIRDTVCWLYGSGFPKSHNLKHEDWQGWGTALKPAFEPIILARKPISEKNIAANVLEHGTGAINVDGCRIEGSMDGSWGGKQLSSIGFHGTEIAGFKTQQHPAGRWPANVIHDGSDEVMEAFARFGESKSTGTAGQGISPIYGEFNRLDTGNQIGKNDTGTAARFFYTAKADRSDRLKSKHPTVKPVDLIAYLCRLITPPKGTVLDPFAGSGTTGAAAMREGLDAILIEREADYIQDIEYRLQHAEGADTPLFSGEPAQSDMFGDAA